MKKLMLFVCLLYSHLCLASGATDIMGEILIDLNHFPTDTDKSFLDEILADSESTADEKALAKIIGRIQHKPEAEDVSTLVRLSRSKSKELQLLAEATLSIEHTVSAEKKAALETMLDQDQ